MIKKVSSLLMILLIAAFSAGCTITHKYDAYQGRVVDAETKKPIEGVAVLIVYRTQQFGLAGSVSQFADAQETLTDKNGEFRIPPTRINRFRILSGWEGHPEVKLFKSKYGCYPRHKDVKPVFEYGALPSEQHVTIELPRIETREDRIESTHCSPSLDIPYTRAKRFIDMVNKEREDIGLSTEQFK